MSDTEQCDRCGEEQEELTGLCHNGEVWATVCMSCHDDLTVETSGLDENSNPIPEEVWEENNSSFTYEPPEKPGEMWTQDEYTELYDRVISRRIEWFCDRCTGLGPIQSLQKARRHVETHHGTSLVEKYETTQEESENDSESSESCEKSEENYGLTDFSSKSNKSKQ
jgi:hypothetical protein